MRERGRESCHPLVPPEMAAVVRARPGYSQAQELLGLLCGFRGQVPGPFATAFSGTLVGSWMEVELGLEPVPI